MKNFDESEIKDICPSDMEDLVKLHARMLSDTLSRLTLSMNLMQKGFPWNESGLELAVQHVLNDMGMLLADFAGLSAMVGGFKEPISFDFSGRAAKEFETLKVYSRYAKRKADEHERYCIPRSLEDLQ